MSRGISTTADIPFAPEDQRGLLPTWRETFLLLVVALAACCVNLNRGLWVDEYTSWSEIAKPLPEMIESRLRAGHLPLYFLGLRAWVAAVGDSEVAMRLPSVLMVLGTAAVFHRLAGRLLGIDGARIAGMLFVLHEGVVWAGQTARPYAMTLGAGVVTAYALLRFIEDGRRRWPACMFIATLLTGAAYPAHAQAAGAMGLVLAWLSWRQPESRRRAFVAIAALALPWVLLAVPVQILAQKQGAFDGIRLSMRLQGVLDAITRVVFGDYRYWAGPWMQYVSTAFIVAYAACAWRLFGSRPDVAGRFPALLVGAWAVAAPVGLGVAASVLSGKDLIGQMRYYAPSLGGLILVVAAGAVWMRRHVHLARVPLMPQLVAVVLVLLPLKGWLQDDGDGSVQFREQLAYREARSNEYAGNRFVGSVGFLRYELRDLVPPPALKLLPEGSLTAARRELAEFETAGNVWLVVYSNNRKSAIDQLMKDLPPPWWAVEDEAGNRIEIDAKDMRAVMIRRWSPGETAP